MGRDGGYFEAHDAHAERGGGGRGDEWGWRGAIAMRV